MAGQLEKAGQKVCFLGSFDGASPGYDLFAVGETQPVAAPSWGRRHAARLRELSLRAKASYVARKARGRWRVAVNALAYGNRLLRYRVGEIYRRLGRGLPEPLRRDYFLVNHFRAEKAYRPRPYGGSMTVFQSLGVFRDRDLGWSPFVGGLEIHEIAGNHRRHRDLMTGEFIESVTGHLKACLDRADRHTGTAA
jgi:thioesterase domain-containing protein